MLKLMGALCVMVGALWWGLSAVGELRRRVETLEGLREGLSYLDRELTFRLAALPELLEQLGQKDSSPAAAFFGEVFCQLQKDPEGGLRQSWRVAMTRHLDLLHAGERQVLMEVGQALGRYDAQTQSKTLARAGRRLEAYRQTAQEEAKRLGRVYAALAVAGGAGFVLVLL